jgi:hypothetical protein
MPYDPTIPNPLTDRVAGLTAAWTAMQHRWREFREKQYKAYRYSIGDMLTQKAREQLAEDRRPALEFQLPNQTILYLAGKLKRDTTKIKAVPMSPDDVESAPMISSLVNDWAMEGCSGYNEMAAAGLDAAIGGVGFVTNYYHYRDDPEGNHYTSRLDPFLCMFDTDAKRIDQKDCKHLSYSPMLTADEIIQIYKKYLDQPTIDLIRSEAAAYEGASVSLWGKARSWFDRIMNWNFTESNWSADNKARQREGLISDLVNAQEGLYRCIEWHDRRMVTKKYMVDPIMGNVEELPMTPDAQQDEAVVAQKLAASSPGSFTQEVTTELYYITVSVPALLKDRFVMEMPYPVQKSAYSIKWVLCYDFHPDVTKSRSVMDALIAPTDFFNQRQMTALEVAMDSVNPGIDAPKNSIDKEDLEAWTSKKRNVIRFFKVTKGDAPKRAHPQPEVFNMLKVMSEEGKDLHEVISGISPNARGYQESAGESGRLFKERAANSEIMTAHFFDNMQEFMSGVFRYTFKELQVFMPFERMVRLLNDEGDPYWLVLNQQTLEGVKNDITKSEFDFKPDMQALGESQREEVVAKMADGVQLISDPITKEYVASLIFQNMGVPEGKKIAKFIQDRIGVTQMEQQRSAQIAETQARMQMAQQAKDLITPAAPPKAAAPAGPPTR